MKEVIWCVIVAILIEALIFWGELNYVRQLNRQDILKKFTLEDMQNKDLVKAFQFWWNEAKDLLN